ncbi:hypothetical protein Leryth_007044 [Lithospermum erythrorhizon]|nr:hypothetical protein Leryth_007044 [Lithospermum erythrorhizon]
MNSCRKILAEYMQNGTLVDHLYKFKEASHCEWCCWGLISHRGASPGVIHRDIKGSNILLDGNFEAKISDFGLAKLVKTTSDPKITSVSTTIFKGTFGYMDPEYFYTQRLTTKTDIYAFGVVLLVVPQWSQ